MEPATIGPAPGARLTLSDLIAIAFCHNSGMKSKAISEHFPVSDRHIRRLVAAFPEAHPEIHGAICLYNRVMASHTFIDSDVMNEDEAPMDESADQQFLALDYARQKAVTRRLKANVKALKLRVARLSAIRRKAELEKAELENADRDADDEGDQCVAESMPILHEMMMLSEVHPNGRRYSDSMMRFAYSLMTYSPTGYKFMRKVLILPSRSQRYSCAVQRMKQSLTNIEESYHLLENFKSFGQGPKVVCALGVDAFSFRLFLRRSSPLEEVRKRLTPEQLRVLSPILEDKELMAIDTTDDSDSEEESDEYLADPFNDLTQENVNKLFDSYNSCFTYVVMPLNSQLPCLNIHLEPCSSGSANDSTVDVLERVIQKCEMYNIDVALIAADGDRGWNRKFDRVFEVLEKHPYTSLGDLSLDVYELCRNDGVPLAVTDLLHYVKAARSRYIDHKIAVTLGNVEVQTSCEMAEDVLNVGLAISDRSQLGRMRDFYPLQLFTIKNVLLLLSNDMYADAYYFLPHAILLLVVRCPFFRMDFRMQLLTIAYLLFCEVYTDLSSHSRNMSEKTSTMKATQRQSKFTDIRTFAEISSIRLILCTIVAFGAAFQLHSHDLRTDALGTHIVEQRIGLGRKDGDARWERILSRFSTSALRTLFQELDQIDVGVSKRLKVAGCRLSEEGDWTIDDFDVDLFSWVMVHSLSEAGRAEESFPLGMERVIIWLSMIQDVLNERQSEIGQVWMPNPAANSAIMARLMQSTLKAYGIEKEAPEGSGH